MEIKRLSVNELKALIDSGKDYCLIDVRNPNEFEYCNIGATLIPMNEIPLKLSAIPREKPVIVHCHHGGRSKRVIQWLQENHGFENLYNLDGGIHAWSCEIDPEIPQY